MPTLPLYVALAMFALFGGMFPESAQSQAEGKRGGAHAAASLHSEFSQINGSAPFTVMVRLKLDKHWHSYWKNPGDSGLETSIDWRLPEGYAASQIVWQPPRRMALGPLTNYGYEDNAYFLAEITPPPSGAAGNVAIAADANWLVCNDICVPESATLEITLVRGARNVPSKDGALIRRLKASANPPALTLKGAAIDGDGAEILLAGDVPKNIRDVYFYPEDGGLIDHAAPQSFSYDNGILRVRMARGPGEAPKIIAGFLEISAGGKPRYFRVEGEGAPAQASADMPAPSGDAAQYLPALFLAFLGGIILNAMPCVFPVLSLKALAIAKKSRKERGVIRRHGIAYALGCLSFFALIGGALLALRAAGQEIGWGYQMQSPLFVAALALLVFAVGLNLIGFLPFNVGFGFGGGSGKESFAGTYATGALAVLVATPCTAPFMATALGAALSFPPAYALGVFLALGLGLAFPYMTIAFVPGALALLPRPGAWMETFKESLAFPMFLTCIWLVWVLAQQAGSDGAAMWGISAVALCFVIWIKRRAQKGGAALFAMAALGLCACVYPFVLISQAPPRAEKNAQALTSAPYSESALQSALDAGTPAFVYATASWCITCKVNERAALDSPRVAAAFKKHGIAVFKADWTNADPAITHYLEKFGRNGVPLYVFYPGRAAKPRVLPQLLTPSVVIQAMEP